MKRIVKILVALLISITISSLLTVFSFTNLFAFIETDIYFPNLKASAEKDTRLFYNAISEYRQSMIEKYGKIVKEDYISRAYSATLSVEILNRQSAAFNELMAENPALEGIRLLDISGKKINYSSLPGDIELSTATSRKYFTLEQTDPDIAGDKIALRKEDPPSLLLDGKKQRIIFRFAVLDNDGTFKGVAIFMIKLKELENILLNDHGLVFRDLRIIDGAGFMIDTSGRLAGITGKDDVDILEQNLKDAWKRNNSNDISSDVFKIGHDQERMVIYSLAIEQTGSVGVVFSASKFELSVTDKMIILSMLYITLFLISFLFINIKQDPITIVAQRMHRFQVEFLKEFFEKKDKIDIMHWQNEIDSRREEIKRYMKRGIRRMTQIKENEIDTYIIDSWNEVVSIVKSKIEKPHDENRELARIESLLRKVLEEGKIVIASPQRIANETTTSQELKPIDMQIDKTAETEEIGELEEFDENEKTEKEEGKIDESEKREEITDEKENMRDEKMQDHGLNEKSGTIIAPQIEDDIYELEEIAESEKIEDRVDREGGIDVEEISELESISDSYLPDGDQTEDEPKKEAKDIETSYIAKEEIIEPLEELSEVEEYSSQAVAEKKMPDKRESDEKIEILEIVPEIKQLPPYPVEKLEELPLVDEEEKRVLTENAAREEFLSYMKTGEIRVIELNDLLQELKIKNENVVLENGVYRIKEDLYRSQDDRKIGVHKGLRAIAESILKGNQRKRGEVSGIDELYGTSEFLEESERKMLQEKLRQKRKEIPRRKSIPVTAAGLDLDSYMQYFSYHITDKVMIHAIGEMIKKGKAVCAAVFVEEDDLKVSLAIGLTNRSALMFIFKKEDFIYDQHLKQRRIIVINDIFQKLTIFSKCLVSDDLRFIKSALFLPAVIERKNSYLFLGFPAAGQLKNLNLVFEQLDLRLPAFENLR